MAVEMGSFCSASGAGATALVESGTRGPSDDYDYLPTLLLRSPLLAGARQKS